MGKRHICCEAGEHDHVMETLHRTVPPMEEITEVAELLKLFGDPTRVRILFHLSVAEMCVGHLAEALEMNQPAVSNQLKLLKEANLVKCRKEGKNVFYSLADAHVGIVLSMGLEHVRE